MTIAPAPGCRPGKTGYPAGSIGQPDRAMEGEGEKRCGACNMHGPKRCIGKEWAPLSPGFASLIKPRELLAPHGSENGYPTRKAAEKPGPVGGRQFDHD